MDMNTDIDEETWSTMIAELCEDDEIAN